jgi:hypothetical protein
MTATGSETDTLIGLNDECETRPQARESPLLVAKEAPDVDDGRFRMRLACQP